MDLYQIWFRGSSRGRTQLCGILLLSAHGFRFCEGSKFAISHWLGRSPLTQCWRYRTACDSGEVAIKRVFKNVLVGLGPKLFVKRLQRYLHKFPIMERTTWLIHSVDTDTSDVWYIYGKWCYRCSLFRSGQVTVLYTTFGLLNAVYFLTRLSYY